MNKLESNEETGHVSAPVVGDGSNVGQEPARKDTTAPQDELEAFEALRAIVAFKDGALTTASAAYMIEIAEAALSAAAKPDPELVDMQDRAIELCTKLGYSWTGAGWLHTAPAAAKPVEPMTWDQFKAAIRAEFQEDGDDSMDEATADEVETSMRIVRVVERHHRIPSAPGAEQEVTIAGLESATGHLSTLVDEAHSILADLYQYACDLQSDTRGGRSERGEVSLMDRAEDWLAARPEQAKPMEAMSYRLLTDDDRIERGDEVLCDDCLSWEPVPRMFVGHPFRPAFHVPHRRPVGITKEGA